MTNPAFGATQSNEIWNDVLDSTIAKIRERYSRIENPSDSIVMCNALLLLRNVLNSIGRSRSSVVWSDERFVSNLETRINYLVSHLPPELHNSSVNGLIEDLENFKFDPLAPGQTRISETSTPQIHDYVPMQKSWRPFTLKSSYSYKDAYRHSLGDDIRKDGEEKSIGPKAYIKEFISDIHVKHLPKATRNKLRRLFESSSLYRADVNLIKMYDCNIGGCTYLDLVLSCILPHASRSNAMDFENFLFVFLVQNPYELIQMVH